ncbi:MAG: haloacid dehalogenase-like hydrolase [Spirochaetes bacterium]|nr:haloacid dehalogenase-like hydrolase [Spirochaetota bacterium]
MKPQYSHIVFCDFDGTITTVETFVGMCKTYAPELFDTIGKKMWAKEITIREGVRQLLESLPSSLYPQMLSYIDDKEMRAGFPEFLDYCNAHKIPVVIISGGLYDSVVRKLGYLKEKVAGVYAAKIDASGEYLKVYSDYEYEGELVAKAKIMSNYHSQCTIAIGDGPTDIEMAKYANIVFARGLLKKFLPKDKEYYEWDDFYDVMDTLSIIIEQRKFD